MAHMVMVMNLMIIRQIFKYLHITGQLLGEIYTV
jgi:hypothetical protein